MNAEQLHTIATTVIEDVDDTSILKKFARLSNYLANLTSNPGDGNTQQNAQSAKKELFDALDALNEKRWSAGITQAIVDLGGEILVSDELKSEIDVSFQTDAMTPATVQNLVNDLQTDIQTFVDKLSALANAFEALNIGEQELNPGEVELGVLVPRENIDNRLDMFASELANFDEALKLFSVVATGTREDFAITYISASDLKFFVRPNLKTAALISTTVASILISLNQMAALKETIDTLVGFELDEDDLQRLRGTADRQLDERLSQMVPDLVEKFCIDKRDHDKKENQVRLRHAIDFIAPRLERGYVIEMRIGVLPKPEHYEDEEDDEREDLPDLDVELIDELQDQAHKLKLIEPKGEPILALKKPDWTGSDGSGEQDK